MKQIDKDALVAEIEKICSEEKAIFDEQCRGGYEPSPSPAVVCMKMEHLLSFLDTLEVKEVNLDEEADNYWETLTSDVKDFIYFNDFYKIAKHFFELGLKARTDKELVEEVYAHIDSIKDTADRMTSGNFMHNRASIKFSANTIAKVLESIGLKVQKGE